MQKSLIEFAHEFVSSSKDPVSFASIWDYVKKEAGLSDDEAAKKAGQFFTNLMLDGRFVTLGENQWDLRSRHTFDKVHIDMKDVYSDVETVDDDSEEEVEEKIYNSAFEEAAPEEEFKENEESDSEDSKPESEF